MNPNRTRRRAGTNTVSPVAIASGMVLALTVTLALAACTGTAGRADATGGTAAAERDAPGGDAGPPTVAPAAAGVSPAALAEAERTTRTRSIEVAGRVRPRTRIEHGAPVNGIVREVAVAPGDRVTQGTAILTIEREEVGQTFRPVPLTARIGGIVATVEVQPSQQVSAGATLATIVGDDGYILEAQISDKDAFSVSVGRPVTARTTAGATVSGTLVARSPEPDYETGLFTLTFRFPDAAAVGIGTFLLVELPTETLDGVFIPREAVDRRYGQSFVWTVDEAAGVLRRSEIEPGATLGEEVLVAAGLEPGTRFLTRVTGRERDGAPIADGDGAAREG